jgi:5-hydroxyisourate hydrolase-like protein (transthyretin family)
MRFYAITVVFLVCVAICGCGGRYSTYRGEKPAAGKSGITGKVLMKEDGSPAAGVEVVLCRDAMMLAGCTGQIGSTTTDSNGVYWFRNIPPGEYLPAVMISDTKFFVLQEQKRGSYMPVAIKYPVSADQVIQIAPLELEEAPENAAARNVKLLSPVGSETISETRPTLKWEPVADVKSYFVGLTRVDTDPPVAIEVTEHPFEPVSVPYLAVPSDLPDGVYKWQVFYESKNSPTGMSGEDSFFSVATGRR